MPTKKKELHLIPKDFHVALLNSLEAGEEVYWWEFPSFWRTFGPQTRIHRSLFYAGFSFSFSMFFGVFLWCSVFLFGYEVDLHVGIKLLIMWGLFILWLFFLSVVLALGHRNGQNEVFGKVLYVATNYRLIRIHRPFLRTISKKFGFVFRVFSYQHIREFTKFKPPQPNKLEESLGNIRLEFHTDGAGACLFEPLFQTPIPFQSNYKNKGRRSSGNIISATSIDSFHHLEEENNDYDDDVFNTEDNRLNGYNGFLYVENVKELMPCLQRLTNGTLTSLTSSFTSPPPVIFPDDEIEMSVIPSNPSNSPRSSSSSSSIAVTSSPMTRRKVESSINRKLRRQEQIEHEAAQNRQLELRRAKNKKNWRLLIFGQFALTVLFTGGFASLMFTYQQIGFWKLLALAIFACDGVLPICFFMMYALSFSTVVEIFNLSLDSLKKDKRHELYEQQYENPNAIVPEGAAAKATKIAASGFNDSEEDLEKQLHYNDDDDDEVDLETENSLLDDL